MATNRVEFFTCLTNFDLIMYESLHFPPSPQIHFFEFVWLFLDFWLIVFQLLKFIFIDSSCVPNHSVTKLYREYLSSVSQMIVISTMHHTSSNAQILTGPCQAICNIESVQLYECADDVILLFCEFVIGFHFSQLTNRSSNLSSSSLFSSFAYFLYASVNLSFLNIFSDITL